MADLGHDYYGLSFQLDMSIKVICFTTSFRGIQSLPLKTPKILTPEYPDRTRNYLLTPKSVLSTQKPRTTPKISGRFRGWPRVVFYLPPNDLCLPIKWYIYKGKRGT